MTPATPRFLSAGKTDQGPVRSNNEDRVYIEDARGIYLVVDGMGGHQAGEHAAEIAVERIRARLERQTGTAEQRIREAITLANNGIFEAAEARPEWHGMACVLTLATMDGNRVRIGHVGDSRLYKIRNGMIAKITHDHSPVGEREDSGELAESEAMVHPRRNEVYRDVGSVARTPEDPDFIEMTEISCEPDSALLLCSDGLSDAIPSAEILKIVERNAADRHQAVNELIEAAAKKGKDNISAILVVGERFAAAVARTSEEDTARLTAPPGETPWYHSPVLWLAAGLILGAAAASAYFLFLQRLTSTPVETTAIVGPPTSLQEALAKAKAGSTLEVTAGTYTGPVTLKDGVDLIARPAYEAVILGRVTASGIHRARIEGFRIREGGLHLENSDIVIARDEITDSRGPAIEFGGDSRGAVVGCSIHNNSGPAISIAQSSTPSIERNLLFDNTGPGLVMHSHVPPIVTGNVLYGNGTEAAWLPPGGEEDIVKRNFFLSGGKLDKSPKLRILEAPK
jgi:serine/threonine protein phosphatase PrpC